MPDQYHALWWTEHVYHVPGIMSDTPSRLRTLYNNNKSVFYQLLVKSSNFGRFWDGLGRKNEVSKWPILTKNLDFRGHLSTFRAENTPKSGPSRSKNNALRNPEQLQINFTKVQKTTFFAPKIAKPRVPILEKVSIFGCILDLKPQILSQKC